MASAWHVRGKMWHGYVWAGYSSNYTQCLAFFRVSENPAQGWTHWAPGTLQACANQSVYLDFCQSKQVLQRPWLCDKGVLQDTALLLGPYANLSFISCRQEHSHSVNAMNAFNEKPDRRPALTAWTPPVEEVFAVIQVQGHSIPGTICTSSWSVGWHSEHLQVTAQKRSLCCDKINIYFCKLPMYRQKGLSKTSPANRVNVNCQSYFMLGKVLMHSSQFTEHMPDW